MKFPPHLDYLKSKEMVWFNPCYAFHGFWKEFNEFRQARSFSFQDAWKHREMKRAKEIYATSIAALGVRQGETPQRAWWVNKPVQDPPDGLIGTVSQTVEGNIINVREVEVVEDLQGDIPQTLQNKLKGKNYEPNTILVCLLNGMGVYDFEKLSVWVREQSLSLQHIFLVAHGGRITGNQLTKEEILKTGMKVVLVQLAPVFVFTEIDPFTTCAAIQKSQPAWLRFQGRGRGSGFSEITVDTPPKLF